LHVVVVERLRELGHDVALVSAGAPPSVSMLDRLIGFERKLFRARMDSLLDMMPGQDLSPARPQAALRLDLTGNGAAVASPVLAPIFSGSQSLSKPAWMLMRGQLPDVDILLDGTRSLAHAEPMVDSRLS